MTEELQEYIYGNKAIKSIKERTNNSYAIDIADKLSDMILFHRKVRKNGDEAMKVWDD